jgi:hypothetical protein
MVGGRRPPAASTGDHARLSLPQPPVAPVEATGHEPGHPGRFRDEGECPPPEPAPLPQAWIVRSFLGMAVLALLWLGMSALVVFTYLGGVS